MFATRARFAAPASAALAAVAGNGLWRQPARCEQGSLNKSEFTSFPLLEVRTVNHDTKVLKCKLPSDQHVLGMSVSSLVMVGGEKGEDGKAPARPYTPITTNEQKGYFELMVKGYPTGVVSKYLCSLKPGDSVQVKGPFPKLPYKANMKKRIGMIAGGSGITPMLQVIKEILNNPDDKTQIALVFANHTPADILLRSELDDMAKNSKGQLTVTYIVDKNDVADPKIRHVGYVTSDLVYSTMPPPSSDALVYVCGPPAMLTAVAGNKKIEKGKPPAQGEVGGVLKEAGYTEDMVYKF